MNNLLYANAIWAISFILWKLICSRTSFFRLNRMYLLWGFPLIYSITLLSNVLHSSSTGETMASITLPQVTPALTNTQHPTQMIASLSFETVYLLVATIFAMLLIYRIVITYQKVSLIKQSKIQCDHSFSFFNFIHVAPGLAEKDAQNILAHETVHAAHHHTFEKLTIWALCVVNWLNPFFWIAKSELNKVHEFEADSVAAQKSNGSYGYTLMAVALNTSSAMLLEHRFNQVTIKNRIAMLHKKKSRKADQLRFAFIVPVATCALLITTSGNAEVQSVVHENTDKGSQTITQPDVMPEFKGGMEAMSKYLGEQIKYPESAKANKVEGTVYVGFVIDNMGKVKNVSIKRGVNTEIDAEAMRVIQGMPAWNPGTKDGKAVSTEMVLPIKFKL